MAETGKEFEEWWNSLSKEQQEEWKRLAIERIKKMPNHYKLSIG